MSGGDALELELTLGPSRVKWLRHTVFSAGCVAAGLLLLRMQPMVGWATIGLFGCSAVVGIVSLLPGSGSLRLTPEGFEERVLFRTSRQSWQDIECFVAYNGPNEAVWFVFKPDHTRETFLRHVSRVVGGVDGGLRDTFGLSADELAGLLNDWLDRHERR